MYFCGNKKYVQYLISKGASILDLDDKGESVFVKAFYQDSPCLLVKVKTSVLCDCS
jgi:hypothetical protein